MRFGVILGLAFFAGYLWSGQFKTAYPKPEDEGYQELGAGLMEDKFLEFLAQDLNQVIAIPTDVTIILGECGTPNAFYDPDQKEITICYELMDYFIQVFAEDAESDDEVGEAVVGATLFTFYHEVGHALVDVLDLPITGREEDAVDQLSTIILISLDEEEEADGVGTNAILSAAMWFYKESEQQADSFVDELPFYGEHALSPTRFFNLICWTYGADPEMNTFIVDDGILPEERAVQCPEEWDRFSKAWDSLLEKYFK